MERRNQTGTMLWVKSLLCKCKEQSLDPQYSCKCQVGIAVTTILVLRRQWQIPGTNWPARLDKSRRSGFRKRPWFCKLSGEWLRETSDVGLCPPHTCPHMYAQCTWKWRERKKGGRKGGKKGERQHFYKEESQGTEGVNNLPTISLKQNNRNGVSADFGPHDEDNAYGHHQQLTPGPACRQAYSNLG